MDKQIEEILKEVKQNNIDSITITLNDENGVSLKIYTIYKDGSIDA